MAEDKSTEYKSEDDETNTRNYILYSSEIIGIALMLIAFISAGIVATHTAMWTLYDSYLYEYNKITIIAFILEMICLFSPILVLVAWAIMLPSRDLSWLKLIVVIESLILIGLLWIISMRTVFGGAT